MTTADAALPQATTGDDRDACARILMVTSVVSTVLVSIGVVSWLVVPGLRGHDVLWVGVVGILMGIPHGAADFLLPQSDGRMSVRRALARMLTLYLLIFAAGLALVFLVPVVVYLMVLGLAVLHWGGGDAGFGRERRGEASSYGGVVEVIAYGGAIIFTKAAWWPEEVRRILATVAPGAADMTMTPLEIAAYVTVAAMAVHLVRMIAARKWLDVYEIILLAALGILLPPAVAFGIYFGLWHSLRQTVRLFVDARRGSPAENRINQTVLARTIVAGTVVTLVLTAAVVLLSSQYSGRALAFGFGDWSMAILGALVAPHVLTVFRYDLWKTRLKPDHG
jgi:Brp/Blh family beta-carotene 15,15'-monooxygenase